MFSTCLLVAALTTGSYDPSAEDRIPPPSPEVSRTPPTFSIGTPAFRIPYNVGGREGEVEYVELLSSTDRGQSWTTEGIATTPRGVFELRGKKPGDYWLTARVKRKNGGLDPANPAELQPLMSIHVTANQETAKPAAPAPDDATALEAELTRIELDLIRKDLTHLAGANSLTPDTANRLDQLRARLMMIKAHRTMNGMGLVPPPILPVPEAMFPPAPQIPPAVSWVPMPVPPAGSQRPIPVGR